MKSLSSSLFVFLVCGMLSHTQADTGFLSRVILSDKSQGSSMDNLNQTLNGIFFTFGLGQSNLITCFNETSSQNILGITTPLEGMAKGIGNGNYQEVQISAIANILSLITASDVSECANNSTDFQALFQAIQLDPTDLGNLNYFISNATLLGEALIPIQALISSGNYYQAGLGLGALLRVSALKIKNSSPEVNFINGLIASFFSYMQIGDYSSLDGCFDETSSGKVIDFLTQFADVCVKNMYEPDPVVEFLNVNGSQFKTDLESTLTCVSQNSVVQQVTSTLNITLFDDEFNSGFIKYVNSSRSIASSFFFPSAQILQGGMDKNVSYNAGQGLMYMLSGYSQFETGIKNFNNRGKVTVNHDDFSTMVSTIFQSFNASYTDFENCFDDVTAQQFSQVVFDFGYILGMVYQGTSSFTLTSFYAGFAEELDEVQSQIQCAIQTQDWLDLLKGANISESYASYKDFPVLMLNFSQTTGLGVENIFGQAWNFLNGGSPNMAGAKLSEIFFLLHDRFFSEQLTEYNRFLRTINGLYAGLGQTQPGGILNCIDETNTGNEYVINQALKGWADTVYEADDAHQATIDYFNGDGKAGLDALKDLLSCKMGTTDIQVLSQATGVDLGSDQFQELVLNVTRLNIFKIFMRSVHSGYEYFDYYSAGEMLAQIISLF